MDSRRPLGDNMVRLLHVPADFDQPATVRRVAPTLETLRGLIGGGWLEAVTRFAGPFSYHAYVDEEGVYKELAVNERATRLLGLVVRGDAIFLGDKPNGDEADVPEFVLDVARGHQTLREEDSHDEDL